MAKKLLAGAVITLAVWLGCRALMRREEDEYLLGQKRSQLNGASQ